MSGRGGRGGRGFGRGRGGGGAPEIKDDDGQYITHTVAGPPPLYPDNPELAEMAEPAEEEEEIKALWRTLTTFWQHSPYHLQLSQSKLSGAKRSLEDFQDPQKRSRGVDTSGLAKVLTLHPKYFPEELYSSKERRTSTLAASAAAQKAYWSAAGAQTRDTTGLPFDRLAQLEARGELTEAGSPKAGEGKLKVEGEPEDDPENVDVDEPDEEDFEDDDYLQGQEYDDDDGYEDDALEDEEGGAYY